MADKVNTDLFEPTRSQNVFRFAFGIPSFESNIVEFSLISYSPNLRVCSKEDCGSCYCHNSHHLATADYLSTFASSSFSISTRRFTSLVNVSSKAL